MLGNLINEQNNYYGKFSFVLSLTLILGCVFQVIGSFVFIIWKTSFSNSVQYNLSTMFVIIVIVVVLINIVGIILGLISIYIKKEKNMVKARSGITINVLSLLFITLGYEIFYNSVMRVTQILLMIFT